MKFNAEQSVYFNKSVEPETSMEMMGSISKLYTANPRFTIDLFINSIGGSVSDSFATYDFITTILKPNLRTIALGEVSSSAVPIFLAGEPRYIGKSAVLKFHRFSTTMSCDARLTSEICKKTIENFRRSENIYVQILVNRTGGKITKKMANALLDDLATVSAIEAVGLGLAHEIL